MATKAQKRPVGASVVVAALAVLDIVLTLALEDYSGVCVRLINLVNQ